MAMDGFRTFVNTDAEVEDPTSTSCEPSHNAPEKKRKRLPKPSTMKSNGKKKTSTTHVSSELSGFETEERADVEIEEGDSETRSSAGDESGGEFDMAIRPDERDTFDDSSEVHSSTPSPRGLPVRPPQKTSTLQVRPSDHGKDATSSRVEQRSIPPEQQQVVPSSAAPVPPGRKVVVRYGATISSPNQPQDIPSPTKFPVRGSILAPGGSDQATFPLRGSTPATGQPEILALLH